MRVTLSGWSGMIVMVNAIRRLALGNMLLNLSSPLHELSEIENLRFKDVNYNWRSQ